MGVSIVKQLEQLAELLIILYEKLDIIQKAVFMSIQINGKLHGVDLDVHLDEINKALGEDKES